MAQWTRKRAFEPDAEDWLVRRDGLVVGRVFWYMNQMGRPAPWRWSIITLPASSGYVATREEALEKVKEGASDRWAHPPYTGDR